MFRMGKEEAEAVARVIETKELFRVNNGLKESEKFEEEWAKVIGSDFSILMSSGTAALISALVGVGVGPGDEVIVPGYTFMASASAVLAVGAIPVLTEIDETMTIDVEDIKKKISKYTKAIIPVHICGYPCNMDAICEIAKEHNLYIIEDACQADGGKYKGKRLGSIGHAGAFSFNYYKLISAGEGGAFVTNDKLAYDRAMIYHDGGAAFRPYASDFEVPVFMGSQMRTNEIAGAIMRVQLTRMDGIIADLKRIKTTICDALAGCDKFTVAPSHDIDGDLGTHIPLRFKDYETAKKFSEDETIGGYLVFESGKHIYTNWGPVMEKRGAHCDALNPYMLPQNKDLNMEVSHDMLPKTLDLVKRTYHVTLHCDWTDEEVQAKIAAILKRASEI